MFVSPLLNLHIQNPYLNSQKRKQWRETMKEKHNNQREKRNNQTIFFSKNSSSPTIKHNNQRDTMKSTNPRPNWGFARIGSHKFCWSCWDRIGSELLELIGSDWWFSLTLSCSISLVPHKSSPGFCSDWIGPGFC